ncbi:hypothetical protein ES705_09505 [subsurface metagenome]
MEYNLAIQTIAELLDIKANKIDRELKDNLLLKIGKLKLLELQST